MIKLHPRLAEFIHSKVLLKNDIPEDRKEILRKLVNFVASRVADGKPAELIFICTHNSRRSHLSQIWAQVAADYYGIPNVVTYSGGTEATAFNPRAVAALERAGFIIEKQNHSENPIYLISYSPEKAALRCFSKRYDHPDNPRRDFCAVMTCSEADEACPAVFGAEARIPLRYEDPKAFDDTPQEAQKYDERCLQIARELFWAMREVKQAD
jgi:hypothetical protein